jgi:hypothetical protein
MKGHVLMMNAKKMAAATAAVAAVCGVSAAAVLSADGGSEPAAARTNAATGAQQVTTRALSPQLEAAFGAFRTGSAARSQVVTLTSPVLTAAQRIQDETRNRAPEDPVIDYGRAVPVEMTGDGAPEAWIAPAGDKVCTIIASETGTSGGCFTVAEAASGDAVTVVADPQGGASRRVTVVNVVPDGGNVVRAAIDAKSAAPLAGASTLPDGKNAVGARLPADTTLEGGTRPWDLGRLPTNTIR